MFNYFIASPSMPLFFVHFLTFKNALRSAVISARRRIFITGIGSKSQHRQPHT